MNDQLIQPNTLFLNGCTVQEAVINYEVGTIYHKTNFNMFHLSADGLTAEEYRAIKQKLDKVFEEENKKIDK